jgi:hypothetical protein
METAEHREPCESRGSRTDLGAPGGEIPPGDSTIATNFSLGPDVSFRGEAEVGWAAEFAASVENDPERTCAGSQLALKRCQLIKIDGFVIFDQEASTVGVAAKIIWEFAGLSGAEAPP